MIRSILTTVAVAASLTLAACSGKSAPETVLLSAADSLHEGILGWQKVTDGPVSLATEGIVDVDVEIFAGQVTVITRPTITKTTVTATRIGTHGWDRERESMDSLGDIRYTISLDRSSGTDRVVVRAATDHEEPHFQSLRIDIETPDLGNIRVITKRGPIWVENSRGSAELITTRSKIRMMTPWKLDAPLTLVTSDGDIDLRIRGESTGAVDAATVAGRVWTKVQYGEWIATDSNNDIANLRATLNRGTNPITLRTGNADIFLSVVPSPVTQNPAPPVRRVP
jgi:hypothetical protein